MTELCYLNKFHTPYIPARFGPIKGRPDFDSALLCDVFKEIYGSYK